MQTPPALLQYFSFFLTYGSFEFFHFMIILRMQKFEFGRYCRCFCCNFFKQENENECILNFYESDTPRPTHLNLSE